MKLAVTIGLGDIVDPVFSDKRPATMDCDGKIKSCSVYNIHQYHKATHWIAESAAAVKRKVRNKPKGDFSSTKPTLSEMDHSKCTCPKGCTRITEEAEFGNTTKQVVGWWEDKSGSAVPEMIWHEQTTTSQEIKSKIRCVKPKKKKTIKVGDAETISKALARLRSERGDP